MQSTTEMGPPTVCQVLGTKQSVQRSEYHRKRCGYRTAAITSYSISPIFSTLQHVLETRFTTRATMEGLLPRLTGISECHDQLNQLLPSFGNASASIHNIGISLFTRKAWYSTGYPTSDLSIMWDIVEDFCVSCGM